jgi:hypothetical protein
LSGSTSPLSPLPQERGFAELSSPLLLWEKGPGDEVFSILIIYANKHSNKPLLKKEFSKGKHRFSLLLFYDLSPYLSPT